MGKTANGLSFGLFHQNLLLIKMKRHLYVLEFVLSACESWYCLAVTVDKGRASILVIKFVFRTQTGLSNRPPV